MDIPLKTLKSGFSLPVYGLGTFMMGGRLERDSTNDERDIATIKSAIEHGITHIDTAEVYGGGHCEELVGEAIKGYDRSKLIITSKLRSGTTGTREDVFKACKESLKRLGTDHLDLYLLHKYTHPGVPIKSVMQAMDDLVETGLVRAIGVCNMTVNRFQEAQKYTKNQLVCNQLDYSLQIREVVERGILEYCQQNDIFLTAWGPLNKGMLKQHGILQELSKKYDKTAYQIALNWMIAQPNVITIPKTTSVEHLEENLGALGWELEKQDIERLTKEFPDQKTVSNRVPLDYEADIAP